MQNKINKIKHTGVYVLVVDDYLYKTGDIFGDRCKEPTVTITWSECNDFEDGEVIPLAEANKRFEFTR